ncbi:MAG: polysaccharide deacetylase family protein [Pyrinomonadaceae bacterium]
MKRIVMVGVLVFAVLSLLMLCGASAIKAQDLSAFFKNTEGAFVLYDLKHDRYIRYDEARCRQRFSPKSTFKIPNSLIGLETGVIGDANYVIPWDRQKYPPQDNWNQEPFIHWAQDQTLRSAIKAVTFDDLPYVAIEQQYLPNAQRATKEILHVLKTHRVPVVAFVNEGKLQVADEVDARIALLQQWVDAGMILGNHTYSHPDFNTLTIRQFQNEIIKGEVVTRRLMQSHQPYQLYFRHPMTHTGDIQAKKEAIENFLAARGYKVTPHTIENDDFIFNVCYVRALRNKDEAMAKRLREAYLNFTIAVIEFAERISPQVFGREITQTLLVHANDINADCLDEMLRRFAAREYRFVTLEEAMNDPAYQTKDTYISKAGPTWLWRWMKSKGMEVSFKDDPEPPQWVTDLFRQRS